jgi:hypothetical protein
MSAGTHPITKLLHEWRSSDKSAASRLMDLVFRELAPPLSASP